MTPLFLPAEILHAIADATNPTSADFLASTIRAELSSAHARGDFEPTRRILERLDPFFREHPDSRTLLERLADDGDAPFLEFALSFPAFHAAALDARHDGLLALCAQADAGADAMRVLLPLFPAPRIDACLQWSRLSTLERQKPTPLMLLAMQSEPDPVLMAELLAAGADPNAVDAEGHDALMHLAKNDEGETNRRKCLDLLLPVSDPKRRSQKGGTAFLDAANYGNLMLVRRLFPVSEPLATLANGHNALHLAQQNQEWAVIDFLAEWFPREQMNAIFIAAGGQKSLPKWAARLEAEAIAGVIQTPRNSKSADAKGDAASGLPRQALKL